jgi:hypothetical protein
LAEAAFPIAAPSTGAAEAEPIEPALAASAAVATTKIIDLRIALSLVVGHGGLEHDPEKLQTFRTRSCSKSKTLERYPVQPEWITL